MGLDSDDTACSTAAEIMEKINMIDLTDEDLLNGYVSDLFGFKTEVNKIPSGSVMIDCKEGTLEERMKLEALFEGSGASALRRMRDPSNPEASFAYTFDDMDELEKFLNFVATSA